MTAKELRRLSRAELPKPLIIERREIERPNEKISGRKPS